MKKIALVLLIIVSLSLVAALQTTYNPFTGKLDYIRSTSELGNSSFNESYADGLYIAQSEEGNLNVNGSSFWDNFNAPNFTQFISGISTLTIDESWGSLVWCRLTGCNMTGDLNMTGNNLFGIASLTADDLFGNLSADFVTIALGGGSPTVDQVQEYLDNTGSSGFFEGGELSDGGAGTVDVAAGSGFIRTTNDDNAELQSFKWSASAGIAVPDDTTQYVYVDDSGVISLSQDEFLEAADKIKIGVVTDEGGTIIHEFALGVRLQESVASAGRFIRRVHGIERNNRLGGLIFGQSGDANRDLTLTAGQLEWGRTSYTINSVDTSGVDTFFTYSASGVENPTESQWPNEQYDNAGTLTTMSNNKWANLFFWLEPDGHLIMVYGRSQFNTEGEADNEGVPSTSLPSRVSETGILTGRFTFKKSANTATISSAFTQLFANAGVTDHGDLAGLTDDDHVQYLLTDGSRDNTGNQTFSDYIIQSTNKKKCWDGPACTVWTCYNGTDFIINNNNASITC